MRYSFYDDGHRRRPIYRRRRAGIVAGAGVLKRIATFIYFADRLLIHDLRLSIFPQTQIIFEDAKITLLCRRVFDTPWCLLLVFTSFVFSSLHRTPPRPLPPAPSPPLAAITVLPACARCAPLLWRAANDSRPGLKPFNAHATA